MQRAACALPSAALPMCPAPTAARKQREVARRAEALLDAAQALLSERGYLGLTMDRLAEATEYSKGTVYQHFANKEDLVAALAERGAALRAELFERALAFQGKTRERMGAIWAAAELFRQLRPHHDQAGRILETNSIRDKVSTERGAALGAYEARCFASTLRVVHEALAAGELELPDGASPAQLCVGLWRLHMGASLLRDQERLLGGPASADAAQALDANAELLLDGYGWRPLSRDHDYVAARQRALRELFPDESRAAGPS